SALTLNYESDEVVLKYFIGRCIFCGMCAYVCPQDAITITKEFELATPELNDLYDEVVHTAVKCNVCGKPFTTVKLVKEVEKRIDGGDMSPLFNTCPECRRKLTARRVGSGVTGVSVE
ncbi:MAG: 4Fe-4S binding protein, partial [Zestosphaera sp.]